MKYPLSIRRAMLLATSCALLQQGGLVLAAQADDAAPMAGTRPSINTLTPQPIAAALGAAAMGSNSGANAGANDAQGNVAELMGLIHDARLSELRTTYNGSYGASLFFYPQQMAYYIALFQDKHFWRVIRTEDMGRADAVYAGFVQQTVQLSDVEIRRTQLQAQKAYIQDIIAMSEDRAKRLQADLDVARTQQAQVSSYQRQAQDEAVALHAEKDQAQAQLRQVQSEVQQLQRQTELGLPTFK
jgi:RecA/RadA recombinase